MRISDWSSDVCSSDLDILYRNPDEDESFTGFKTLSQEFRLTGATDRVDWMVGFFYSDEDLDRTETYRIGPHYEPYLSIALLSLVNPALGQLPNEPTFLADRKSTRLNSSHYCTSRMPSSA